MIEALRRVAQRIHYPLELMWTEVFKAAVMVHFAAEYAAVLYNIGIVYSELGQFDDAIIRLKRAVQLDPGHAHAWVGIGTRTTACASPTRPLRHSSEPSRRIPTTATPVAI